MNRIFFIFSFIILCLTNSYGQFATKDASITKNYSKIEKHIIDTIANLPEVKKRALYVESQTRNKRHIEVTIWEKPTIKHKYYWVRVMEDNNLTFYTHFNFFVFPKNLQIRYFDTTNDTTVTLESWRKSSKYN